MVALNLSSLGVKTTLLGVTGKDDDSEKIIDLDHPIHRYLRRPDPSHQPRLHAPHHPRKQVGICCSPRRLEVLEARLLLMHENNDELQPSLTDLVKKLSKVDLVLVEGFKQEKHPKIEVVRKSRDQNLIAENDPTILALATDVEISSEKTCMNLNDTIGIANFIGNYLEL